MNRSQHLWHVLACFCVTLLVCLPVTVSAEVNPEIANCEEIKDEATQTQADFCSAHVGCKLVMGIHKTCAKVKTFLDRLKEKVGEGTQTLFGRRKEVDAVQVFEAYRETELADPRLASYRDKASSPQWSNLTSGAQAIRASMSKDSLRKEAGFFENGGLKSVRYEDVAADQDVRSIQFIYNEGRLTAFSSKRMATAPYTTTGPFESFASDGGANVSGRMGGDPPGERRTLMRLVNNSIFEGVQLDSPEQLRRGFFSLRGTLTRADGTSFNGQMEWTIKDQSWRRIEGAEYGADGKKREEGQYRNDALAEGKRYAPDGKLLASVTTLGDERRAAQAKVEREQAEARRLALEQKQREQKAKQDEEARIAKMNPGELFALADELNAAGKPEEARKAYRTLLSRYPNHALAATAAQALSSGSGGAARPDAGAAPAGRREGGTARGGDCERLLAAQEQEFAALNQRELQGVSANTERVMWMTSQRMQLIDQNCPNNPSYAEMRKQLKAAFDQSQQVCTQVSTGPCTAQPHR